MKRLILLLLLLIPLTASSQTRIQMQEENGIYKIPCEVNGLRMKFIFDTGASNVCISLTEAKFMLENDYISGEDILGTATAKIADGSIVENTIIRLKEIKISNIILKDVEATVTHSMSAPLLLGQSAIQKLGAIQIDGNELTILEHNTTKSDEEIDQMFNEAENFYNKKLYSAAAKKYQELYDLGVLSDSGIEILADSYTNNHDFNTAITYYKKIKDFSNIDKIWYYNGLGHCYLMLKDYDMAIYYYEILSEYVDNKEGLDEDLYCLVQEGLALAYEISGNYDKAIKIYEALLSRYLHLKKIDYESALELMERGKLNDEKIEKYMFEVFRCGFVKTGYSERGFELLKIIAKRGNKYALEYIEQ